MDIWQLSDGSWQTQDPNTGAFVSFIAPDQATALAAATDYFNAEAAAPGVDPVDALTALLVQNGVISQADAEAAVPSAADTIQSVLAAPAQPAPPQTQQA